MTFYSLKYIDEQLNIELGNELSDKRSKSTSQGVLNCFNIKNIMSMNQVLTY